MKPITQVLILTLVVVAFAATSATAQPNWPENHRLYFCDFTWPDGSGGSSVIYFEGLPEKAHVFPDGNQIKRGRRILFVGGNKLDNGVALAWKPKELKDPPGGTNLEFILDLDPPIQCKRFENYGDFYLKFFDCSNRIEQQCSRRPH